MICLLHRIETTAAADSREAAELVVICATVARDTQAVFHINDDRQFLRVDARCNGAALRDLVAALDRAGLLD